MCGMPGMVEQLADGEFQVVKDRENGKGVRWWQESSQDGREAMNLTRSLVLFMTGVFKMIFAGGSM
jgi:hypothetical protein